MAELELEIISGTIAAVVFQNYDNGYSVLRLDVGAGQTVTVVGTVPMPAVGEYLTVTGKWNNRSGYGRQFEAEFLDRSLPGTAHQIQAYLSGRVVKGIGPVLAARIVAHFGDQTLMVMEMEPARLAEVSGISLQKAQQIGEDFARQNGLRRVMEFFGLYQLDPSLAVRAYRLYGDETVDQIMQDPYILMEKGLDAPFSAVDRFAVQLGIAADDRRRVEAGIFFELTYNLQGGHSFLPREKLVAATVQLLDVDTSCVEEQLDSNCEHDRLISCSLAGLDVIYLPELYEAEQYCTSRLQQFANKAIPAPARLDKTLKRISSLSSVAYSPQQEAAIRAAATNGLLMLTGGPGTGKTTTLNGVLMLFQELGLSYVLAAPTGRAAKRLSEVTGEEASTIHRLLEAGIDPATGWMVFAKDENDPLKTDAVIVDEMSMVDIQLLHSLLRAVPENARLILVGDPDQLPPVGPGFPFGDCLRSNTLPAVRLTDIFRQAQQSLIVMNAHRINAGELPELKRVDSDFFFLRRNSEDAVLQTIAQLCAQRLPQNMGIPTDQIQVLSPTRKGGVGTASLNQLLQQTLNPPSAEKKERKSGDFSFREGDRVMQIRNNYDIIWKKTDGSAVGTGIFNGDVGIIRSINPGNEQLTVVFDDREADYDFAMLHELEPAYAITVHKSQGSEYRAVILAAWSGSPYLLTRNVLYTAVTRARELLIIVGREDVVAVMTQNERRNRRYTGLKLRLQGKCE